MNAEYIYLKNITITDINTYAVEGWQVVSIYKIVGDEENRFNIVLAKDEFINLNKNVETQLIKDETTGKEFYLDKSISYGDFLVITFLMIFLVFGITKFLLEFFIPRFINFKKQ